MAQIISPDSAETSPRKCCRALELKRRSLTSVLERGAAGLVQRKRAGEHRLPHLWACHNSPAGLPFRRNERAKAYERYWPGKDTKAKALPHIS